jgi:transporter family protein
MNNHYQVISFSAVTIVMWGLWGFFGKLALQRQMAPTTLFVAEVFISAICAVPLFLAVYCSNNGFSVQHVSWNYFGLASGGALALGLFFYYLALEKGPVSVVVALTSIYPVISVLLSFMVLNERPSASQWVGVILVTAGAFLLLSGPIGALPEPNETSQVDDASGM